MDKELEKCLLTKEEEAEAGGKWLPERWEEKSYNDFQAEALLLKAYPIIKKAVTEEIKKWFEESCSEHAQDFEGKARVKRKFCRTCWQSLWGGIE